MDGWLVRLIERASRKELFRGESALHEACYSAAPPATVLVIVHHHPEAALIQDKHGRTPLHWALSSKNQFPKARLLLAFLKRQQANSGSIVNAGEAETSWTAPTIQNMLLARNELGYTALDHACSSGAPSDVIESLIQLCPQAASVKRSGRTPLHQLLDFVRANELQVETPSMKILLHAHPTAVSEPDRLGNVPLHLAAYEQTNLDAFEMLLQESKKNRYGDVNGNVNVVAMKNRLGSTPLHVAAMNNAPSHVIDQIIEASPATVTAMDVDGNVPLHLAFMYRASVVLKSKLILHGGERLLGIVNDKGQTPIQGAEFVEDVYDILRLMPHVACSCY